MTVPSDAISLLVNHIQYLKKIPGLSGARFIFTPESNLAWEGIWTQTELYRAGLQDICVMVEDDNRAGVKINKEFKKLMAMGLNYKFLEKSVYFYKDFLCIGENNCAEDMKKEIIEQLLNYSRILKQSNDIHKPPVEIYGGKQGHGFDDHAIAIMINLVMKNRFFTNSEKYSKWY